MRWWQNNKSVVCWQIRTVVPNERIFCERSVQTIFNKVRKSLDWFPQTFFSRSLLFLLFRSLRGVVLLPFGDLVGLFFSAGDFDDRRKIWRRLTLLLLSEFARVAFNLSQLLPQGFPRVPFLHQFRLLQEVLLPNLPNLVAFLEVALHVFKQRNQTDKVVKQDDSDAVVTKLETDLQVIQERCEADEEVSHNQQSHFVEHFLLEAIFTFVRAHAHEHNLDEDSCDLQGQLPNEDLVNEDHGKREN